MRYLFLLSVVTALFVVSYAGLLQGSVNIFDAVKGRIEVGVPSGVSVDLDVGIPGTNGNSNKMEQNRYVPAVQPVKRMDDDEEVFI